MILLYITELQNVKVSLTGNQLVALGVPRGPKVGQILDEIHRAKLDGKISTSVEEERFASQLIST